MAKKDAKGRWIDGAGNPVPPRYIGAVDKRRDRLVEKDFRLALQAQTRLEQFKAQVADDIAAYLKWLGEKNGENALNPGGNYMLTGFSGDKRIHIKVNQVLEFDEQLQVAKVKIDRCLEKWTEGGNQNAKVVIFDAFKVDQKGRVDTRRILALRRLKIKDRDWRAAMDLITEAVMVTGTRSYLLFQERAENGEWRTLRLDLAGV